MMCSRMERADIPPAVAIRRTPHSEAITADHMDEAAIGMEAGVLPEQVAVGVQGLGQATALGG